MKTEDRNSYIEKYKKATKINKPVVKLFAECSYSLIYFIGTLILVVYLWGMFSGKFSPILSSNWVTLYFLVLSWIIIGIVYAILSGAREEYSLIPALTSWWVLWNLEEQVSNKTVEIRKMSLEEYLASETIISMLNIGTLLMNLNPLLAGLSNVVTNDLHAKYHLEFMDWLPQQPIFESLEHLYLNSKAMKYLEKNGRQEWAVERELILGLVLEFVNMKETASESVKLVNKANEIATEADGLAELLKIKEGGN